MTLREAIEQYVLWRKAHGAKFTSGANLLRQLLRHADGDAECDAVSTAQVLAFLAGAGPLTRHRENKYYSLAGFWRHAISRGHATRSPLPDNEPRSPVRAPPYIYSRDELRRLLDPAIIETSRRGAVQLDAVTFRTLLLLLYGAGLRFSEATRLTLADVDLAEAILTIRVTKFYKSRLVPVGPQLAMVLTRQLAERPHKHRRGYGSLAGFWRHRLRRWFRSRATLHTYRHAARSPLPDLSMTPEQQASLRHYAARQARMGELVTLGPWSPGRAQSGAAELSRHHRGASLLLPVRRRERAAPAS